MNPLVNPRHDSRIKVLEGLPAEMASLVPSIAWLDTDSTLGKRQLVLPSDLHLISVYCSDGLNKGEVGGACELEVTVSMLRTRPTTIQTRRRRRLAFALLTPAAALRVLGGPLRGLVDRRIPLEHFCGRAEQRKLCEALASARSPGDRTRGLAAWIEERMHRRGKLTVGEARVAEATQVMLQGGWRSGMTALAASLSVTRRHIEREFDKWLGISPVSYARLVRFQQAVAALAGGASTIGVAMDWGYADQSHLTRVVREFAFMTPRELRLSASWAGRGRSRLAVAGRVLMIDAEDATASAIEGTVALRTGSSEAPAHEAKRTRAQCPMALMA